MKESHDEAGGAALRPRLRIPVAVSGAFGRRFTVLVQSRWPQILASLTALFAIDIVRNYAFRAGTVGTMLDDGLVLVVAVIAFGIGSASILGTLVAEALALHGIRRAVATVVLAPAGAALAMGAIALAWPVGLQAEAVGDGISTSAFVLRNLWYYSATSLLLAAYFASRDRDAAIERAAQRAELERAIVRRAVLESRLKVIQARVEPELLFEVLADVQRLYGSAPREADALLDDLIVYLRAALPQMRGDASTLGREIRLARAFVKLTASGRDRSFACVDTIPPEVAALPFPPMVLLPLAHAAADARSGEMAFDASVFPEPGAGSADVRVSITLRSRSRVAGVAGWQAERIAPLREILRTYFGAAAALDVVAGPDHLAATLTFTIARSLAASGQDTPGPATAAASNP